MSIMREGRGYLNDLVQESYYDIDSHKEEYRDKAILNTVEVHFSGNHRGFKVSWYIPSVEIGEGAGEYYTWFAGEPMSTFSKALNPQHELWPGNSSFTTTLGDLRRYLDL